MSFSVNNRNAHFGGGGGGGGFGRSDQHTVYSSTPGVGVGGRVQNSLCGACFGIAIFLAAFPLLVWNEGTVVTTTRSLDEGMQLVVSVGDGAKVKAENDGKLVHIAGAVSNRGFIADQELGVGADALLLRRSVSMYQWKERKRESTRTDAHGTKHKSTTYSYSREWSSARVNHGHFSDPSGHENPDRWPVASAAWSAPSVSLGAYTLSPGLQGAIGASEPLRLSEADLLAMAARLKTGGARITDGGGATNNNNNNNGALVSRKMGLAVQGGELFSGRSLTHPTVGDYRVSYTIGRPTHLSVVAKQEGSSGRLAPYRTRAGDTLEMLDEGRASATELFEAAHAANTVKAWAFRGLGWFLMFLGLNMLLAPLSSLASSVPLVGGMLASVVGGGACCAAVLVSASFALLTIASAWMAYRPALACTIVAVALVPWVSHYQNSKGKGKGKGNSAAGPTAAAAPAAGAVASGRRAPERVATRSAAGARKEKF
jgi:hypothetical protein